MTFANDGALIINCAGTKAEETCDLIFVGDPEKVEKDYSNQFMGKTRGTETLVACSIAVNFACSFHGDFERLFKEQDGNRGRERQIQSAVTLGLKASRHLQAHAFVTVENEFRRMVQNRESVGSTDLKNALEKLKKEWKSNSESVYYLWNRLQSGRFVDQYQRQYFGAGIGGDNGRITCWPFGDIAEILCEGFPVYGSFPPTSFDLQSGRNEIDKQTTKVDWAWQRAGWLCASRITTHGKRLGSRIPSRTESRAPDPDITLPSEQIPPAQDSKVGSSTVPMHDMPWWSMRQEALMRLAQAVPPMPDPGKVWDHVVDAFAECLAIFGNGDLNPRKEKSRSRFDLHFAWRILAKLQQEGLDEESERVLITRWIMGNEALSATEEASVETLVRQRRSPFPDEVRFARDMETLLKWREPTFHRLLRMIPEIRIGKLYSVDRRDIQSYRDIRERLLNYRESEIESPLNIGVYGAPGDGKSFAVKEILNAVYSQKSKVEFLEYNLAQFAGPTDLTDAMLEIQNVALSGHVPVAFWDEYDTMVGTTPLGWLSYFLGPMQDGKFFVNRRLRKLPRCIFVFAGSMFTSFGAMRALDVLARKKNLEIPGREPIPASACKDDTKIGRFTTQEWLNAKGPDFKSRLSGVLDIAGIARQKPIPITTKSSSSILEIDVNLTQDEASAKIRTALVIRSIFEREAKWLIDKNDRLSISDQALRALLDDHAGYEHGIRSLESVIRMSSLYGRTAFDKSVVPTSAQLRIHANPGLFPEDN